MEWTIAKVRDAWLAFFKTKNHHILPSASLVPNNDPSLLWINSGVATLKPYFEGKMTPPSLRLVNSQKAIRTNDIENVGFTARHHTFFEMLGNFSIGDYFKKEAIMWAWEFLTSPKWLGFDPHQLYITVYEDDQEAYEIWTNVIQVDPKKIIKGSKTTNFWDMGQGPCGPNTEIYYDRGIKYDPQKLGIELIKNDIENDRYIEIWNIVFSQFNNDGFNNYTNLPRKNIDTGAGLERIVSILQKVPTNFDINLFQVIIKKCETFTSFRYHINNYFAPTKEQTAINSAFRIISDHIRCLVFAISDGVFPSNKGRGYILRRLIRRAAVYGNKLQIIHPFLSELVPSVIMLMKDHYPELEKQQQLVTEIIKVEEVKFSKTLGTGQEMLLQMLKTAKKISAAAAFKLFETYGYPLELTVEIAKEYGATVDINAYNKLLEEHKLQARKARPLIKALATQKDFLLNCNITSEFIGYESEISSGKVTLLALDNKEVTSLSNDEGLVVLDQTPFYAEKGGQAADTGTMSTMKAQIDVVDVQTGPNNLIMHYVSVNGTLNLGDKIISKVNHKQRLLTKKNHTGTHLLHAALRKILGEHIMQSGSFNNQDYLRLDFNHYQSLDEKEIIKLETQIANWIASKTPAEILYVTYEEALAMNALAFFGEKYDTTVRVVKFGDFSIELCGGTHCDNTVEVEDLLITNVESKGSGSFRIHALTSHQTINYFLEQKVAAIKTNTIELYQKYLQQANLKANLSISSLYETIINLTVTKSDYRNGKLLLSKLYDEFKSWQKTIDATITLQQQRQYDHLNPILQTDGSYRLIATFNNIKPSILQTISDRLRQKYSSLLLVFLNYLSDNETFILIAMNEQFLQQKQKNARLFLTMIFNHFPGRGGGNELLSQGKINQKITAADITKYFD